MGCSEPPDRNTHQQSRRDLDALVNGARAQTRFARQDSRGRMGHCLERLQRHFRGSERPLDFPHTGSPWPGCAPAPLQPLPGPRRPACAGETGSEHTCRKKGKKILRSGWKWQKERAPRTRVRGWSEKWRERNRGLGRGQSLCPTSQGQNTSTLQTGHPVGIQRSRDPGRLLCDHHEQVTQFPVPLALRTLRVHSVSGLTTRSVTPRLCSLSKDAGLSHVVVSRPDPARNAVQTSSVRSHSRLTARRTEAL